MMVYRSRCVQCGDRLDRRLHNARFCSRACYETYRLAHADRSPAAKARRRQRLAEDYVDGIIDREAYKETLALYRREGLI
jgi:hypothetical protein